LSLGPTFAQWKLLYRMQAVGCPIDSRHLSLPQRPLAVVNHPSDLGNANGSNVFRRLDYTWLALYLEINVSSRVRIGALHLRAHWLSGKPTLVGTCVEHPDSYCMPLQPEGNHFTFSRLQVLNPWIKPGSVLARGLHVKKYVLLKGADFQAIDDPEYLDAQFSIDDWMGNEMVFPLVVVNRPMPGWR
jgi:hypothetical protein